MKITRYDEIPIEKLTIGLSQARIRDVKRHIDDLAESIRQIGLIEPIVVAPGDEPGTFEVVTGQRRFLAVKQLGWKTIRAGVLAEKPAGDLAKAISLTENMVREDMSTKDYIDACTELFRRYGSIKAVSEELGLPYHKVQQYVKFDQLIPELQKKVTDGELELGVALRAQKAASGSGDVNTALAATLAEEMKDMAGVQRQQLEKEAVRNPGAPIEQILEAGRKPLKSTKITLVIANELGQALGNYAHEQGTGSDEAAVELITTGLVQRGYLSEEDE